MLEAELHGRAYKKSEHRKALIPLLAGRSDGSVEFKHQNISSVLVEMGLPYVEGYKPRGNYQGLLATEVESFLDQRPGFLEQLAAAPTLNPSAIPQAVVSRPQPDHRRSAREDHRSQPHRQAVAVPEGAEDRLRREGCRQPQAWQAGRGVRLRPGAAPAQGSGTG